MYDFKEILIIRYGEVSLKGRNKPWFERKLEGRVRSAVSKVVGPGEFILQRDNGLMTLSGPGSDIPADVELLIKAVTKVFGVSTVSPAVRITDRHLKTICEAAVDFVRKRLESAGESRQISFKVFGKRSDKSYPITSPEMSAKVGEAILDSLKGLVKVDVIDPEIALNVHLRTDEVFIYDEKRGGLGGLPLGTNGKGMVLFSGGIDSPVAAWLTAKRGMRIELIHFHSYPYTSKRAQEKVRELAGILAGYCGEMKIHFINLLPIQEQIAKLCPEEYMTLIIRRYMMRIAEIVAFESGCQMLITGENLGQVASQTAEALCVTDTVCKLPVLRPLIALDKTDIMALAEEIGTFEKSIEPYEDCCTVFLPKHPATRPRIDDVEAAESALGNGEEMMSSCISSTEVESIKPE